MEWYEIFRVSSLVESSAGVTAELRIGRLNQQDALDLKSMLDALPGHIAIPSVLFDPSAIAFGGSISLPIEADGVGDEPADE